MPFRGDLNFGSGPSNIAHKPKTFARNRNDLRETLLTTADDILMESESLDTFPTVANDDMPKSTEAGEPTEEEMVHL